MNTSSRVNKLPFFIIGSPRSGTTLLRLMLANHPDLMIPPECGFLTWLYDSFFSWGRSHFEDPSKRANFAQAVLLSRKFETWGISGDDIEAALIRFKPTSYGEACACVYRLFCENAGKPNAVWGDKNNYHLDYIEKIEGVYPGARFIHIVRDGRDVACSYREVMDTKSASRYRPSLPTDIEKIAIAWASDIRRIRDQLSRLTAKKTIEVCYEDLTKNSEAELSRLCAFLGFEFAGVMLDFHKSACATQTEPLVTIDWKKRTTEPISSATVGRYRNLLTTNEIKKFDFFAKQELSRYGYETI